MSKINMQQLMDDVVHINNQIKGLQMLLDSKRSTIAKYFQKSGNRRIDGDEVVAYQQEKVNIDYDVEMIQATIDKDICLQFIDKSYEVNDWKSFVNFCKSKNIKPAELRRFISVKSKVNQQKLNKLYERGIIELKDLEGCYDATVTKSVVLRFKNIEKEIPIN